MTTKGILLASAMLTITGAAQAQDASQAPATPPTATLTPTPPADSRDRLGLNEIVVTAQRRSERLQDVPLTVTELSSSDLAKSGVTSLRDIQNVVSGFTFGGQGTVSQPSIRGVSTLLSAAGSENPNALYVDGIYQATQAVLGNELPDVERVEVLKGPQGTLFGRNATGGAIEVFTRNPSFTPTGSFSVEPSYYTGDGTSRSSARINVKAFVSMPIIPDLVAASVSGGYNYTRGFWTNDSTGERDGLIRKTNFRGKLLVTPSDNFKVTLSGFYIQNNDEGNLLATPYDGLTAAAAYPGSIVPTEPYHAAYDTGPDQNVATLKQYGYSARAELTTELGTFTSLTGYDRTKTVNANSIHNAQASLPCLLNFACIDYNFIVKNREISQELNFASRSFGIFSFVSGLYYYDAKGGTLGFLDPGLAVIAPGAFPVTAQETDFHTTSYAAYSEGTLKPTDKLSLIAGLRYNHEPHNDISFIPASPRIKKTFNSATPRVSVKYDVTNALNVYGTFSIGYKSGLTGVTNTASVPQFAAVKPEKLYAYEAGVKYATHNVSFDASFFYYDYKNKQEQTFTGTSTIIKNTGPVKIYGLDFDANARLTHELSLKGTLSWIPVAKYRDFPDASGQSTTQIPFDATMPPFNCAPGGGCGGYAPLVFDATGLRLARTPKVTANGTIAYARDGFDVSTTVSYSSAVAHDITGTVRQAAYATVSAQMGYSFNGGFRAGIFGRNLSNKAYIVNAVTSASGFVVGYSPPREVGLSLSYSY